MGPVTPHVPLRGLQGLQVRPLLIPAVGDSVAPWPRGSVGTVDLKFPRRPRSLQSEVDNSAERTRRE